MRQMVTKKAGCKFKVRVQTPPYGYRTLAMEMLSQDDIDVIRSHLQRQHALGPDRFRLAIEVQLSRRAGPAKIGRPRKPATLGESALWHLFFS
jgi:hypothetical protein